METQLILELVGYGASLLIAISLMMKSLIRLRVLNALGALVFVVYGLLIRAYPVAVLNGLIVGIDLYYLAQMLRRKDYFTLMEVTPDSAYLHHFLNFHKNDIRHFFPGFDFTPEGGEIVFFVLRDTLPAGVVILLPEEEKARVVLDYALKDYRDFKTGAFLYEDNADLLLNQGIACLEARSTVSEHIHYLQRMGFKHTQDETYERKLHPHVIQEKDL